MPPYTIRNIIVPVDLSETSLNALHTAVFLAELHKAELYVLNVSEELQKFSDTAYNDSSRYLSNTNDVLSALINGMQSGLQTKLTLLQEEGNVAEQVIRLSVKTRADLIVAGTHGASGYREGFVGTNAYAIVKYAACPVLLIPAGKRYTVFKKPIYPVRPLKGAMQRYDVARHLLSGNALLDVFGLSAMKMEKNTSLLERMINEIPFQSGEKTDFRATWGGDGSIADEVLQYSQKTLNDLIILTPVLDATNKPDFIGPHMQRIINCARVPVLNIKKLPAFAMSTN